MAIGDWPAKPDGTYPEPKSAADVKRFLSDPEARLFSGFMYKIMVKKKNERGETIVPFVPNQAQRRLLSRLWHRNIILKARQLGFTTLVCIMWLDHALFNNDQRCGIVAQDKDTAEELFRDKVKLAYDKLPAVIKAALPVGRYAAEEILFSNNSSIKVATSVRGNTIHRLHVSEFGKICAKYPDKAQEVITGSLPAVPLDGVCIIESTAEGQEGKFYDMTQIAIKQAEEGKRLTQLDYRFHFFPWHDDPHYRIEDAALALSDADKEYFALMERLTGKSIDYAQRNWYLATRSATFSDDEQLMWQEYPSTPTEAFQVSSAGFYYAKDMSRLRKRGGICRIPELDIPVNTFWDIGNSDGTAIWFHQQVGMEDRFIGYYEGHGETLKHYVKELHDRGYIFNKHFLPHDAAHKKLSDTNDSVEQMLIALGLRNTVIVPIITELNTGIHMVRKHLASCYFEESACKEGIARIDGYKKKWNRAAGRFIDEPDKSNGCTEGADALRQFAQAKEGGLITIAGSYSRTSSTRTARPWQVA